MTQKKPRHDVSERTTPPANGRPNRLFALLERVVDSIAAAGPVGWISIVALADAGEEQYREDWATTRADEKRAFEQHASAGISSSRRPPTLFEPECRTALQMQMADAFCRYLEMSETI